MTARPRLARHARRIGRVAAGLAAAPWWTLGAVVGLCAALFVLVCAALATGFSDGLRMLKPAPLPAVPLEGEVDS